MCMLNQRAQILLDHETKALLQDAAAAMNVSFGEAIRQAAHYTYKTKKIHHKSAPNKRILANNAITKIRKSLKPSNLTIEEIKAMAHYGHKY